MGPAGRRALNLPPGSARARERTGQPPGRSSPFFDTNRSAFGLAAARLCGRLHVREYLACMGREAAFFDLDRTLLRGASGPVISDALKQVGLLRDRNIPGEALVYRLFNLVGENRP